MTDAADIEAEIVQPEYPAGQPIDEQRRAFVLSYLANPEIDAAIQAETWAIGVEFLKTGATSKAKKKLEAVK
jgi:hypothetical protein